MPSTAALHLQRKRAVLSAEIRELRAQEIREKRLAGYRFRRREKILADAFTIFCAKVPGVAEALAYLRRPRFADDFPETDDELKHILEDRYLAATLDDVNGALSSATGFMEGKADCRRPAEHVAEWTTVQWIRETNLSQARAPAAAEVLSRLDAGRHDTDDKTSDDVGFSHQRLTRRESMTLHRFARRWNLKRGRFATKPDVSLSEKKTKVAALAHGKLLPYFFPHQVKRTCRTRRGNGPDISPPRTQLKPCETTVQKIFLFGWADSRRRSARP